jgi:hypothetical protein
VLGVDVAERWRALPLRPLSDREVVVLAVAITVVTMLTQGYHVGADNHGMQLPLLEMYAGTNPHQNDAFMASLKQSYTSLFYPVVGAMAGVLPLRWVLLALFVVLRSATVWASFHLGRQLYGDDRSAVATAILGATTTTTFAFDTVSGMQTSHDTLAQFVVVTALLLLVRGGARASCAGLVMVACLMPIQPLYAAHFLVVVGCALVLSPSWRTALAPVGVAAVMSLVPVVGTLWWMQQAGSLDPGGNDFPARWLPMMRSWFPMHYYPSTWGVMGWGLVVLPLVMGWSAWTIGGRRTDLLHRIAVVGLIAAGLSGVLSEVAPTPMLIRLHPLRLSWLVWLCLVPSMAHAVLQLLQSTSWRTLGGLLCCCLLAPTGAKEIIWVLLSPMMVMAALNQQIHRRHVVGAVVFVVVVALTLTTDDMGPVAAKSWRLMMIGCAMVALISIALSRRVIDHWRRRVAVLVVINLVVTWGLVRPAGRDWIDTQRACAAQLPSNVKVLVPLRQVAFRVHAKQIPAFDFHDGLLPFHEPRALAAFEAKAALYGWQAPPSEGYAMSFLSQLDALEATLTEADAMRIGAALGAAHAVRSTRLPAWNLPVLYENRSYRLYVLSPN